MPTVPSLDPKTLRRKQIEETFATSYFGFDGRYRVGSPVGNVQVPRRQSLLPGGASIVSTAKGVFATVPQGTYDVERSVRADLNFAPLTYYRITPQAFTGTVFKDLFLYEGEQARYRFYQTIGGTRTLVYELQVTQVSYGAGDALLTINSGAYSSTGTNVIDGKVLRVDDPTLAAILFNGSNYKFVFQNCIYIGCGSFIQQYSGRPSIAVYNCLLLGKQPGPGHANTSAGDAYRCGYNPYFEWSRNTVRGMGGGHLGNSQRTDSAVPYRMDANLYWDIARRRVDANGVPIKSDWSNYDEDGSNPGFTKTSVCNPAEPIGRDICNMWQSNNSGNARDGLTAAIVGSLQVRGALVVQTPLKGSMDDAWNMYQASGTAAQPNVFDGVCVFNNPSYDFNRAAGDPWNMGQIKTNGTGSGPGIQSMSGGLLSDSIPYVQQQDGSYKPGKDESVGSYNIAKYTWHIGLGVQPCIQAGHGNAWQHTTVLGSRLSPDGVAYSSIKNGTSCSLPGIYNFAGSTPASDTNAPFWRNNYLSGLRCICPDPFNIGTPIKDNDTYPYGVKTNDIDTSQAVDNQCVKRDATITEMWQGYSDFLDYVGGTLGFARLGAVPA